MAVKVNHANYDSRMSEYRLIRDCLDGERAIKDQGQLYITKPDGMSTQNYKHYLERGSFVGVPEMTLRALTGTALRKDPMIELPSQLEPMLLNATHEKAPLLVLIEDTVREVLAMGRYGLLLEFPRDGNTVLTTPYTSTWAAETITDWDTQYINGQKELVRVVLISDDDYEGSSVYLECVLEDGIYRQRRFIVEGEKRTDVEDEIIPIVQGKPLSHIPMTIVSHESLRIEDIKPPFLDLCTLTLSHFRNSCDKEHALFLTASPTPWIAGSVTEDKVPQAIGAGTVWNLPENTEVGMLEFSGAGVSAMKENMDEKIAMLATLGARMLSVGINRNETIDTATQRTRSELALLHGAVVMTEAAITRQLRLAAEWMRADPDEVSVTLSRDFIESVIEARQLEAQLKAWQSGAISQQTLYENLQKGEIARADRTWEHEKTLIEEEGGDLTAPIVRLASGDA